ncbi:MAG TPA: PhoU domain-containing protein [Thermodesulfobacteriota bacterium]|nr:PhoU domain-containing protein [Thermodesulfobacteriota bacterium]
MAREIIAEAPRDLEEEVINMCGSAKDMLEATWEGFKRQDKERLIRAEKIGLEIHQKEKELTYSIMTLRSQRDESTEEIEQLGFLPAHLERIGDNIELLIRSTRKIIDDGTCFSEKAIKEVNTLFDKAIELLECLRDALRTKNKVLIRYVREEGKKFQESIGEYSISHQERLIQGTCMPKSSSIYFAMLDYLTEIERHIRQMIDRITFIHERNLAFSRLYQTS